MRQALAFVYLAFGGILVTSAITGESVGELLTKGITPEGKRRLHSKAGGESASGSPSSEGQSGSAPGGVGNPPSGAAFHEGPARPGLEVEPKGKAPSPNKAGDAAAEFPTWGSLEREIKAHKLTPEQVKRKIKEIQAGK